MTPYDNLSNLYEELKNICLDNRCDEWNNSWMWSNNGSLGSHNELIYHYLIYLERDYTLQYEDINSTKIELEYYGSEYRIDIKTRYNEHNFWLFNEDKWRFVQDYVKSIVQLQYNSIQKANSLIVLSSDEVYNKMNVKQRKQKLLKINNK